MSCHATCPPTVVVVVVWQSFCRVSDRTHLKITSSISLIVYAAIFGDLECLLGVVWPIQYMYTIVIHKTFSALVSYK